MMLKAMVRQRLYFRKVKLQEVMEILVPPLILRKAILKTSMISVHNVILTNQERMDSHVEIVENILETTNENHSYLKIKFINNY